MNDMHSENVSQQIDAYLDRVRLHLKSQDTVDAEEVLNDLREHVDQELAEMAQPIDPAQVAALLDRLGEPEQYGPDQEEEPSISVEPDRPQQPKSQDWRLAYLSFGILFGGALLSLAVVAFAEDSYAPGLLMLLLSVLASFVLSRAVVTLENPIQEMAKKWLVYPGLLCTYVPATVLILCILFFGPIETMDKFGDNMDGMLFETASSLGTVVTSSAVAGFSLLLISILAYQIAWRRPQIIQIMLRPFADRWSGGRARKTVLECQVVLLSLSVLLTIFSAILWNLRWE